MKYLSSLAVAGIFVLSLASGLFAAFAYTLTLASCFALIVANDYSSFPRGYAAGRSNGFMSRERLPLAA